MTSPPTRRPLPALIFLVALTLLTALVWWRVLNRGNSSAKAASSPTCSASPTATPTFSVLPRPASVSVQVLNSTQRTGIAGAAQAILKKDGFVTPVIAANDTVAQITGVAEVRYYGTGEIAAATLVSYYFPGSKLVALTAPAATIIVSLGTTYTTVATPAAVQTAITAAHKTLAPAPASTKPSTKPSSKPASGASTKASTTARPSGSTSTHSSPSPTASC